MGRAGPGRDAHAGPADDPLWPRAAADGAGDVRSRSPQNRGPFQLVPALPTQQCDVAVSPPIRTPSGSARGSDTAPRRCN